MFILNSISIEIETLYLNNFLSILFSSKKLKDT